MSKLKKVARTVLPIAVSFIPGIGPVAGAALGAGMGAMGGGGIKGAVMGGLGGFAGAGGLGSVAGAPLAGGLHGATRGSGILGSLTRAAGSGGFSGALASGVRGAAGLLGSGTGAGLFGGGGGGGVGGLLTGGGGGFGNLASNAFSALSGGSALRGAEKAQLNANQQGLNAISPFAQSGTAANNRLSSLLGLGGEDSDDILQQLRESPGYQFRLEQGNRNLGRAQSARGDFFSGRALQQAQNLGQGLADQTYNDYVGQLQQQSGAGQLAAGDMGRLYGEGGDIRANAGIARNNLYSSSLANVLTPRRYDEEMR